MKIKKLTDVYMREVMEKDIKIVKDLELNSYITFKHVIKTFEPCSIYINGRKVVIVDDGYTVLEYSPIDKKYNVRVFVDGYGNIITYYIDIIWSMEYRENEIYYEDLYLDILYDMKYGNNCCNYISLIDEVDLIEAYNENKVTKEQFKCAYDMAHEIMDELLENTNKFINRGVLDYKSFMKNRITEY